MKFRKRVIERAVLRAARTFPAVVITGPRQSGKTTLLKMLFSKTHDYVNLENPDIRIRAVNDPAGFLNQYRLPLIIDEIQYVPELLSYIKTKIDERRKPGQWILTGSQNFTLMHNVTQSLAGRTAVLSLLPFSVSEMTGNAGESENFSTWLKHLPVRFEKSGKNKNRVLLEEILLRGAYPEIAVNKRIDRKIWWSSYVATYLERDIRNLANIGDLSQFERFLVACAIRTGRILNISEIARDIGISVPTAKRWLSLLETGHQVYLLYPYYKNIGKRIIKSPKLYFIEPALCSYLLGFDEPKTLFKSLSFGSLFETVVVSDFLKRFLNSGEKPSMYYLRSRDGLEIDLVVEKEGKLNLFEIKSSMTITPSHIIPLGKMVNELKGSVNKAAIISLADDNFVIKEGIVHYNWEKILIK